MMIKMVTTAACAMAVASGAVAQVATPSAAPATAPSALTETQAGGILVERDTLLRLMVLNEVSTKTTKPGERFVLRVDEPVVVKGVTIIPAGAKAWGEVLTAEKSGAAGKSGKLSARLLYVEAGSHQIPISGENQSKGERGTSQVVLGAIGFGLLAPLALLAPGNNAKLKAGEIFTAYFVDDMLFDPATAKVTMLPQQAPPPIPAQAQ